MEVLSDEAMSLFNNPGTSKVLSTIDSLGALNVVPKGSLSAIDKKTLIYAEISGGKTESNLKPGNRVAALAFTVSPLAGYQVKGRFEGFQTSGPLFEKVGRKVKEMIHVDIRSVGVIKVEEVFSVAPTFVQKK
jgi:predicted pyridoxine 5'-phosphate oxidase superfamily flavin-nucleotide-binding protein